MTVFLFNMVSISMVMMAGVVLIILRDRTETQLLMAAVCLEAMVALGALLWVDPITMDSHYLAIRTIGRVIEGVVMWYVIVNQVRGMQRAIIEPSAAEAMNQELVELRAQLAELKKREEQQQEAVEELKGQTADLLNKTFDRTL